MITATGIATKPAIAEECWGLLGCLAQTIYQKTRFTPASPELLNKLDAKTSEFLAQMEVLFAAVEYRVKQVQQMPVMARCLQTKHTVFVISQVMKLSYFGKDQAGVIFSHLLQSAQKALCLYADHIPSTKLAPNQTTYESATCPKGAANKSCGFHCIAFLNGIPVDGVLETGYRLHKRFAEDHGREISGTTIEELNQIPGITITPKAGFKTTAYPLYTLRRYQVMLSSLEENSHFFISVGGAAVAIATTTNQKLTIYDPHGLARVGASSAAYAQTFTQTYDAALFLTTFRPLFEPESKSKIAPSELGVYKVTFDHETFRMHLAETNRNFTVEGKKTKPSE